MATGFVSDWDIIYLQYDGTWCESAFKVHWKSSPYYRNKKTGQRIKLFWNI